MEYFSEESSTLDPKRVKKERFLYNLFLILSIIFYTVAGFLAFLIIIMTQPYIDGLFSSVQSFIYYYILPIAIVLSIAIIFTKLKNRQYIEYDYTIISGYLRIAKVTNTKKRKHLLNISFSDINKIGKFDSPTFNEYIEKGYKVAFFSKNKEPQQGKGFYYLAVSIDTDSFVMVLECTEGFLKDIVKFGGKYLLSSDFTKTNNSVSKDK